VLTVREVIGDLDVQVLAGEASLELRRRGRVVAELRGGAGRVGLAVAALDVQQLEHGRSPRLGWQQLA